MTEVRISVYYTKSEGGGVESLDVTWDEPPDSVVLAAVIAQLVGRPVARVQHIPTGPHMVPADELCRRILCGHPRHVHAAENPDGGFVGIGAGWCTLCHSAGKCEGFVPPSTAVGGS